MRSKTSGHRIASVTDQRPVVRDWLLMAELRRRPHVSPDGLVS